MAGEEALLLDPGVVERGAGGEVRLGQAVGKVQARPPEVALHHDGPRVASQEEQVPGMVLAGFPRGRGKEHQVDRRLQDGPRVEPEEGAVLE
jgi:hypothetical protein